MADISNLNVTDWTAAPLAASGGVTPSREATLVIDCFQPGLNGRVVIRLADALGLVISGLEDLDRRMRQEKSLNVPEGKRTLPLGRILLDELNRELLIHCGEPSKLDQIISLLKETLEAPK